MTSSYLDKKNIGCNTRVESTAFLTVQGPRIVERSSLAPTAVLVWLITPNLELGQHHGRVTTTRGESTKNYHTPCKLVRGRRSFATSLKEYRVAALLAGEENDLRGGRTYV